MILSGLKVKEEIEKGNIAITPFNENAIGPNSCNLRLDEELLIYTDDVLDMKQKNATKKIIIPDEGLVLEPGKLYLGRTMETTFTDKYVPMLEGRSSIGRLGMFIHVTAGFGDIGFNGTWTLEIAVLQPLRIYKGVEIGQIYFHTIEGDYELYKSEKYLNQNEVQSSKLYKDFENNKI